MDKDIYKTVTESKRTKNTQDKNDPNFFRSLIKSDQLYQKKIENKNFLLEKFSHKLNLKRVSFKLDKKPSTIRNKLLQ